MGGALFERVGGAFHALYVAIALVAVGATIAGSGWSFLALPLVGLPFAIAQFVWDARNKSRALGAEVCGAIALGSVAAAIARLGGLSFPFAIGLWLVLSARSVPTIVYVRARLKLERSRPFDPEPSVRLHAIAAVVIALIALAGWAPGTALVGSLLLVARAMWGLSNRRRGHTPAAVGAQEVVVGLANVLAIAAGYWV